MTPSKVASFSDISQLSLVSSIARRDSPRSVLRKKALNPPEPPDPPDPPDLFESHPVQSSMWSVRRDGLCFNLYSDRFICLCYGTNRFQINRSDLTSALYLWGHLVVFLYRLRRGKFSNLLTHGLVDDPRSFVSIMNLCLSKLRNYSLLDLSFLERFISTSFCLGQKRSLPPSSSFVKSDFPPISLFESSQRGDPFLVSNPIKYFNTLIVLFSWVAVFTGPEKATEIVSTKSDDIGLSKSQCKVTIFQQSGLVVDVMWAHPNRSPNLMWCSLSCRDLLNPMSFYHIYPYGFKLVISMSCVKFLRTLIDHCKLGD
ncbi:unnamed protein product [Cochlearia groenlandica]